MGPKVKQVSTPEHLQMYKKNSATYFQSVLAIPSEKLQNWLRSKNNACAGWVDLSAFYNIRNVRLSDFLE